MLRREEKLVPRMLAPCGCCPRDSSLRHRATFPLSKRKWTGCILVVREDLTHDLGLNFWCVADNVRKGGALNALQIAETCLEAGWLAS